MPAYKDSNNTWYCKFYYQDYNGERRQKKKRGFKLQRDALAWEREFLQNIAYQPDMPFSAFIELYKKDVYPKVRQHTAQTTNYQIKNHILPVFGEMGVASITPKDVADWHNTLIGAGYAETHIRNLHGALSKILNHAVRFYRLQNNPARLVGAPKVPGQMQADKRFWTLDQYNAAIQHVDDLRTKTALMILYWTGMRKGELFALRWNDLNAACTALRIDESYQRLNGSRIEVTPTKTYEKRLVTLPNVLTEQIQEYKSRSYDTSAKNFIISWGKKFIEDGIQQGAALADVPVINVHGLRHSHASLLISQGVNVVLISKRLGHKNVSETLNTYSHFFPDDEAEMIASLNNLVPF